MKRLVLVLAVLVFTAVPAYAFDFGSIFPDILGTGADVLPMGTSDLSTGADSLPTGSDIMPTTGDFGVVPVPEPQQIQQPETTPTIQPEPTPVFQPEPFNTPTSFPGDVPTMPNSPGPIFPQPQPSPSPTPQPQNQPPIFTSSPITTATAGVSYVYAVSVQDSDGPGPLTVSAEVLPAGMSLTGQSLVWIPSASQVGNNQVRLRATDGAGASSTQEFIVTVSASNSGGNGGNGNHAPVFTSTPITTASVGSYYLYRVTATDADHDSLHFVLPTKPSGMFLFEDDGALVYATMVTGFNISFIADGTEYDLELKDVAANGCVFNLNGQTLNRLDEGQNQTLSNGQVFVVTDTHVSFDGCTFEILDPSKQGALLFWVPSASQVGQNAVSIQVSDGKAMATQSFTITVPGNNASAPVQEAEEDFEGVKIESIGIPPDARAGNTVVVTVSLSNDASHKFDDMTLMLSVPDVGIRSGIVGPFDFKGGERVSKTLQMDIPEGVDPGTYIARLTVDSGSLHRIVHRDIDIE